MPERNNCSALAHLPANMSNPHSKYKAVYPFEQRERMTNSGALLREVWYHVPCVRCFVPRWIRAKDIKGGTKPCHSCAQSDKGKLAFAVNEPKLSAKHGGATGGLLWARMAKQHLDAHPTPSELKFEKFLTGIPYAKNVILEDCPHFWIVDFLIAGRIAIEINGGVHKLHRRRDGIKYGELLNAGYTLIVIDEQDVSPEWLLKGLY